MSPEPLNAQPCTLFLLCTVPGSHSGHRQEADVFKEAHTRLHYHWVAHTRHPVVVKAHMSHSSLGVAHMSHSSEEWLMGATM